MNTNWDTSLLIKSEQEYKETIEKLKKLKQKILSYEGKLNQKTEFKKFLKTEEEYSKAFTTLDLYVHLENCIDIKNVNFLAKEKELMDIAENDSKDFAFIDIEEKAFTAGYIKELLNDKELYPHHRAIKKIEEAKKHILTKKEEVLLSGAAFIDQYEDVFHALTTTEMMFKPVKLKNGKTFKVNENTLGLIKDLKSPEDRKNCIISLFNGYKQHNLTLAANYLASVKAENFFATSRNYKSTFDRALKSSEVSEMVYNNLINCVHNSLPLFYSWTKKLKECHGGRLAVSDIKATIYRLPNKKYTYEQSLEIIYDALSVLGADYISALKQLTDGGRVDVYPRPCKRSGAFQTTDNNGNIFVMLNHINDFGSVDTAAHEFGHAMHTYYSDKAQPYALRSYGIFVAEVASTVNELLLFEYMAKNASSKKEKLAYIEMMLQMAQSTIYRQTMFAEFEHYVHTCVNNGTPLTYKDLNDKYLDLVKLYFGKSVKVYPEYQYEWSRIPHFYTSFYVYKYATGMISAMLIVKKIKDDPKFVDTYKTKFLSAGNSADPISVLKSVGVDLENPETIKEAFQLYKDWIEEFKRG